MNKLFNKVPMVSTSHRWDYIHPEMPNGTGLLPDIESYDAGYFGK